MFSGLFYTYAIRICVYLQCLFESVLVLNLVLNGAD